MIVEPTIHYQNIIIYRQQKNIKIKKSAHHFEPLIGCVIMEISIFFSMFIISKTVGFLCSFHV